MKNSGCNLNFAIAKFTGDERQQPRRRTCVPQVAVNEAASVGSADSVVGDPEGWKICEKHIALSLLINEELLFPNEHERIEFI
jgi:hypothetical protein